MPDANEILGEEMPGYNWAFALTAAGVILVLAIEQVVFIFAMSSSEESSKSMELTKYQQTISASKHLHSEECGISQCSHTQNVQTYDEHDHNHDHGHSHGHSSHGHVGGQCSIKPVAHSHCAATAPHAGCTSEDHGHEEEEAAILKNVINSNSLRDLITAYVMEISIAVHSIIIGVDLGLLATSGDVPTLLSLLAALTFHQFIEGVGLGSTIATSRVSLGNAKVIGFVVIFSTTMPLGILIGILTSSDTESSSQMIAKGVANSFAAGSLLYISLTEMVGSYFHAHDLQHKPLLKLGMVLALGAGVLAMAIIAVWA